MLFICTSDSICASYVHKREEYTAPDRKHESDDLLRPIISLGGPIFQLRVFDARVIQGDQAFAQAFLRPVQLGKGQTAFLELTVQETLQHEFVNQLSQAGRRRI